jgi:APA family basic amino acid/polyamine antiporter
VFIYRQRQPDLRRPYRVWGYPLIPAFFIASAAVVLVSSFASNLQGSLIGSGLILLGLPVLAYIRKRYPKVASQ